MQGLVYDIYNEITDFVNKNNITDFPYHHKGIIAGTKYTPYFIIESIRKYKKIFRNDDSGRYADGCFYNIFEELQSIIQSGDDELMYLCDSKDLLDHPLYGDYSYYMGKLDNGVPFVFIDSSHLYSYPCRLYIYGDYTIQIFEENAFPIILEKNETMQQLLISHNIKLIGMILQDIQLPKILEVEEEIKNKERF
jgi:hypothetical protein